MKCVQMEGAFFCSARGDGGKNTAMKDERELQQACTQRNEFVVLGEDVLVCFFHVYNSEM